MCSADNALKKLLAHKDSIHWIGEHCMEDLWCRICSQLQSNSVQYDSGDWFEQVWDMLWNLNLRWISSWTWVTLFLMSYWKVKCIFCTCFQVPNHNSRFYVDINIFSIAFSSVISEHKSPSKCLGSSQFEPNCASSVTFQISFLYFVVDYPCTWLRMCVDADRNWSLHGCLSPTTHSNSQLNPGLV